ncbi:hypothetical protein FRB91_009987 [Serendipita sp. 411]|nr:hypothetical protein FRB91_009987 [Serendipita sp. 411]
MKELVSVRRARRCPLRVDPLRGTSSRTRSKSSHDHPVFDDSDSEYEEGKKSKAELFQELLLQEEIAANISSVTAERSSSPKERRKKKHACFLRNIDLHLKHLIHFHDERKEQFQIVNNVSEVSALTGGTLQLGNDDPKYALDQKPRTPGSLEVVPLPASRSPTLPLLISPRPVKQRRRHTIGDIPSSSREYTTNYQISPSLTDQDRKSSQPMDTRPDLYGAAPVDSPLDPFIIRYRPPDLSVQSAIQPGTEQGDEVSGTLIRDSTDSVLLEPSNSSNRDMDSLLRSSHVSDFPRLSRSTLSTEKIIIPDQATRLSSLPWEVELNTIKAKTELLAGFSLETATPLSAFTILKERPTFEISYFPSPNNLSQTNVKTPPVFGTQTPPGKLQEVVITEAEPMSDPNPPRDEPHVHEDSLQILANSSSLSYPPIRTKASEIQATAPTLFIQSPESKPIPAASGATSEAEASAPPSSKPQRFRTLVRLASKVYASRNSTAETPPAPDTTSSAPRLSPLEYSPLLSIEEHGIAISSRVKEEFKLKLKNEIELPVADGATLEELIADVGDLNEAVSKCAKGLAKLIIRANLRNSRGRQRITSSERAEGVECNVKTRLNMFLVSRVIRPFSVELPVLDDETLRARYEDIETKVPQFIASRWRVLASSSTSRPIQLMASVFSHLASDAARIVIGDFNFNAELSSDMMNLLMPVIRQAYLLGHFIHLEMITFDFDVFLGSSIGDSMNSGQEEEYHKVTYLRRTSISKQENRVSGHWSLGLRRKIFTTDGSTQQRQGVWEVLLKPKILLAGADS